MTPAERAALAALAADERAADDERAAALARGAAALARAALAADRAALAADRAADDERAALAADAARRVESRRPGQTPGRPLADMSDAAIERGAWRDAGRMSHDPAVVGILAPALVEWRAYRATDRGDATTIAADAARGSRPARAAPAPDRVTGAERARAMARGAPDGGYLAAQERDDARRARNHAARARRKAARK